MARAIAIAPAAPRCYRCCHCCCCFRTDVWEPKAIAGVAAVAVVVVVAATAVREATKCAEEVVRRHRRDQVIGPMHSPVEACDRGRRCHHRTPVAIAAVVVGVEWRRLRSKKCKPTRTKKQRRRQRRSVEARSTKVRCAGIRLPAYAWTKRRKRRCCSAHTRSTDLEKTRARASTAD